MGSRRQARQLALEVLYQIDLRGPEGTEEAMTQLDQKSVSQGARDYAVKLIHEITEHREELRTGKLHLAPEAKRLRRPEVLGRERPKPGMEHGGSLRADTITLHPRWD